MREVINFNEGWLFHREDIREEIPVTKNETYWRTKTGSSTIVPADNFDTHNWVVITLPHDYVIEDIPDPKKDNAIGFLRGETSWYRKNFFLGEGDKNKRLVLYFEGIAIQCEIYLNGHLLARNYSAYNPIVVDITDAARFGSSRNVLAVHCIIPEAPEGWWYQGGGIYRNVKLIKTDMVSVDTWGVYVNPEKAFDEKWNVPIETTVRNDSMEVCTAQVISKAVGRDGNVLFETSAEGNIDSFGTSVIKSVAVAQSPKIWDIDSPVTYTLITTILVDGTETDRYETRFGFREFRFDAEKGFFLNGKNRKIKGVCCHGDYGLTGIVLDKSVAYYRLKLLKEMGANGYRSAHNMADEATMDACDDLGLIVFAETRYFSSDDENVRMLRQLVTRDRNHPCVVCWSVGNEEPHSNTQVGKRMAARMKASVLELDKTRPVTLVCCGSDTSSGKDVSEMFPALEPLDIVSENYSLEFHDRLHYNRFPDKPFVITESCALQTSRAHYFPNDYTKGLFSAYDNIISKTDFNNSYRWETWNHIMERDYIAGCFIWAGIEHRGETLWPRLCSQSGLLDLYLQKKDAYFQTMSHYSEEPMVHIVPASWNFEGLEGTPIRVVLYSNCEEVELFLNGKSLGRKKAHINYEAAEWSVPYEKGTISAVAYNGNEICAKDSLTTSGNAAYLRIRCEMDAPKMDDTVVFTCYCEDENGNYVPDASPLVSFSAGGGRVVGTGSDICDHNPPKCSDRRMRMGLISVAVKADKGSDEISLFAEADGLKKAAVTVKLG